MATLKQVNALCDKQGVEFDEAHDDCFYSVMLWAPEGKVFDGTGGECASVTEARGITKAQFWDAVITEVETLVQLE